MTVLEVSSEADGSGESEERCAPIARRSGKDRGNGVGVTGGKGGFDRVPQRGRVQGGQLGDQGEVDEVFDAGAAPRTFVGAGVRVQLLGGLLF